MIQAILSMVFGAVRWTDALPLLRAPVTHSLLPRSILVRSFSPSLVLQGGAVIVAGIGCMAVFQMALSVSQQAGRIQKYQPASDDVSTTTTKTT